MLLYALLQATGNGPISRVSKHPQLSMPARVVEGIVLPTPLPTSEQIRSEMLMIPITRAYTYM
jgi:hypothetical protein